MRRWDWARWGRRGGGVGRGAAWSGGGGGGRCYPGKKAVEPPPSLAPGWYGEPYPASTRCLVNSEGRRQPPPSVVVAAAAAWKRSLRHGRAYMSPPPGHSAVPSVRGLSTKASASSRRHAVSPEKEDDEEKEEAEAHLGVRGREDASEAELDGSWVEEWEEEEDAEPEIGDGRDGGGIVLGNVGWGKQVLSMADEILRLHFEKDIKMFAFRISPRGYVYVRLDKLSNQYGCPTMEEIEKFSDLYKKRLEESGETGEIPEDLALEVSSPGAERLLKVPEDLDRFREMPMLVHYLEEDPESGQSEGKDGVFLLEAVDSEARRCVWKLADVRENRDPLSRGRPLSRKRREWRLEVLFNMLTRVVLYVPC